MFTTPGTSRIDQRFGALILIAAVGWSMLPFIAAVRGYAAGGPAPRTAAIALERVVVLGQRSPNVHLAKSEGASSIR